MNQSRLDYWRLKTREERKTYSQLDAWVHTWRGCYARRRAVGQELLQHAELTQTRIEALRSHSDHELRQGLDQLRPQLTRNQVPIDALIEGLAITSIGCERTLGFTPYREQLAGALSLFQGILAEMATGEGKTLTIALAAVLMGSTRLPCHIITANEYLADRDAEESQPLYSFFGLKASAVGTQTAQPLRQLGYAADITYTTPKSIVADFLRDRLRIGLPAQKSRRLLRRVGGVPLPQDGIVTRGLHFAIIDEADSVLIDEAVTPLIISSKSDTGELEQAVSVARDFCRRMEEDKDFTIKHKHREIHIPPHTVNRFATESNRLPAAWQGHDRIEELLKTAVMAEHFYLRDIHYIIDAGKIELVDEFTGRILPDRTWQEGLHQAVEAKEGIEITAPNETQASMSFQRYFRCYPKLSGLSGTAYESRSELWAIYHLPVVQIPTHRPVQRQLEPTLTSSVSTEKWDAVLAEIKEKQASGRPILVGTRAIGDSESLSEQLTSQGIRHQVLNAVRHKEEAQIIAQAGQQGALTIATNMAGRGTDIKLGPGVVEMGGLHVIATEFHESGRIDRQLVGRAGRQGDPGTARFIVSLEDATIKRFLPTSVRKSLKSLIQGSGPEQGSWLLSKAYLYSQSSAEKMAAKSRKLVLKSDTQLDEQLSFSGKSSHV